MPMKCLELCTVHYEHNVHHPTEMTTELGINISWKSVNIHKKKEKSAGLVIRMSRVVNIIHLFLCKITCDVQTCAFRVYID